MNERVLAGQSIETLLAVLMFVLMGITLERSKIANDLLTTMARVFGPLPGGLAVSVVVVGAFLAASTGIVGATVVTMGLLALPTMLRNGYSPEIATGVIAASGTLGQIIPPSIVIVLLGTLAGDLVFTAQEAAQFPLAVQMPEAIIGEPAGSVCYTIYIVSTATLKPEKAPPVKAAKITLTQIMSSIFPPLLLILAVLGSILGGIATPTEAAGVGAMGALTLAAIRRELTFRHLQEIALSTTKTTAMVFFILIGASLFSLVFRGYGGDELVHGWLSGLPGGVIGATIVVMLVIFLLGFILDFIEITFVVVPIVGPVLMALGVDPIWLGVMIAINLQTSFLTPPFGFALFYLRGVAPPEVETSDIYRGVVPFIGIQLMMLVVLAFLPELATWLPSRIYG